MPGTPSPSARLWRLAAVVGLAGSLVGCAIKTHHDVPITAYDARTGAPLGSMCPKNMQWDGSTCQTLPVVEAPPPPEPADPPGGPAAAPFTSGGNTSATPPADDPEEPPDQALAPSRPTSVPRPQTTSHAPPHDVPKSPPPTPKPTTGPAAPPPKAPPPPPKAPPKPAPPPPPKAPPPKAPPPKSPPPKSPPPPPPDEEEGFDDVSPDEAPHGLTQNQLAPVVLANGFAVKQACWEPAKAKHPNGPPAKLLVQGLIAESGEVTSVKVTGGEADYPGLDQCIETKIRTWKFPAATAPTSGTFPITLTP